MIDYQKLYAAMFRTVTNALEELGHFNVGDARDTLRAVQQRTEEFCIGGDAAGGA